NLYNSLSTSIIGNEDIIKSLSDAVVKSSYWYEGSRQTYSILFIISAYRCG
ncbi:hypothetical protein PFDG_05313, partial [Plasmodium falciparum Dd2]